MLRPIPAAQREIMDPVPVDGWEGGDPVSEDQVGYSSWLQIKIITPPPPIG